MRRTLHAVQVEPVEVVDVGRVGGLDGHQRHPLVQDLVVLEVVQQRPARLPSNSS
jgi:hypothetical protein